MVQNYLLSGSDLEGDKSRRNNSEKTIVGDNIVL